MSKKKVMIVLLIMLSICIISLYTTYAYEETENIQTDNLSNSQYNLKYSLSESSNKKIILNANEEKFIDFKLTNTYDATVKYGMYYYLINPSSLPEGVTITLSEDSINSLEDIIKPQDSKEITIMISNKSEYTIELIVGALIGFEKGKIEDLVTNGEILIK